MGGDEGVHGGVKFYRGSPGAARSYVEADRSRVDDYYLAEGTGVAERYVATVETSTALDDVPGDVLGEGGRCGVHPVDAVLAGVTHGKTPGVTSAVTSVVTLAGTLDGPAYERWVAGYDIDTGAAKGRLRKDAHGLRFVEVVVNGPKTWSLAAALHPKVAAAYDAAQDRAAGEIIGWLAEHATTRVGPRGRQVQVPVEQLEAAVVRHYTSRAGDPHRHLHLQVNARVFAAGRWRGLHSVGVVDSIEAINGIGHAAIACDPGFRAALAAHGYSLDAKCGEVAELARFAGAFSARAAQINANVDRLEARWRRDHPDEEPGRGLRRAWDRRAWALARPDKVIPTDGTEMSQRWVEELHDLGFTPPPPPSATVDRFGVTRPANGVGVGVGAAIGRVNRGAVADLVLLRLGARRSAWNAADVRGEVERILASLDVVCEPVVRRELAEDLTARTLTRCHPLLDRADTPEHVRTLTSMRVLRVERDLTARLAARGRRGGTPGPVDQWPSLVHGLDEAQTKVAAALGGSAALMVVEGAAGAGKTATLSAAQLLVMVQDRQMVVVTPTLKAARVAQHEIGAPAFSAAWLIHQHGWRWDEDGRWTRVPAQPDHRAKLDPGDLLVVDEAGMLDQDTARALLTLADETGARIALVGDRHQLPAVGRGGVLDHATTHAHPSCRHSLDTIHRFADPEYADLTRLMRTGARPGEVFDQLHQRGHIAIHATDLERTATLAATQAATIGQTAVIADTRDQVTALNRAVRDHHATTSNIGQQPEVTTAAGDPIRAGDQVVTRRNDYQLGVANRDRWTVTAVHPTGDLTIHSTGPTQHGRRDERPSRTRVLPASYVHRFVELAYATTVHGAQGDTVVQAHLLIGDSTTAASAYVGMTRGRHRNTAHLVAEDLDHARAMWIDVFARDRADLGPTHAAHTAAEDIDRFGPRLIHPRTTTDQDPERRPLEPEPTPAPSRAPTWGPAR